jgi:hypothetical protein
MKKRGTIRQGQALVFGVDGGGAAGRNPGSMARQLRLEAAGGIYHVLNRGNYRADLFRGAKTQ